MDKKVNSNKNKLIIILIIAVVALISIFGGVKAYNNRTVAADSDAVLQVYVRKAPVGCAVTVKLTEKGEKDYLKADKYQVYYNGELASAVEKLEQPTTVFPARKVGDKVEVHLLTSSDEEIDVVKTKLIKDKSK